MLTQKQILEYAVKGILADIRELEKTVRQGYEYVRQIENGEKPKVTKTKFEILEICRESKEEIERLDKERFELRWKIDVDMKDENEQ